MLAPNGTVLDRLVLTSIESVWLGARRKHQDPRTRGSPSLAEEEKEITALLIQYAAPLAAAMLPR